MYVTSAGAMFPAYKSTIPAAWLLRAQLLDVRKFADVRPDADLIPNWNSVKKKILAMWCKSVYICVCGCNSAPAQRKGWFIMKKIYAVIQITYPNKGETLIKTFDNLKDADDFAFGLNMNRTSGKVEYITALLEGYGI